MNIAIDGPAGAGKSTIARRLAKELSFVYIDTGAMYRVLAYDFLKKGLDPSDQKGIAEEADKAEVTISCTEEGQQVFLNGENVTPYLRTEEVSSMASSSSAYPEVRRKLTIFQKKLAKDGNVVMDGRDIGTVVLPDAEVKIFLTASVETRAKRRYLELLEKNGTAPDLSEIEKDMKERDERDSGREAAPLKQAEDAILVDSSDLTIEEVVEKIRKIAEERMR